MAENSMHVADRQSIMAAAPGRAFDSREIADIWYRRRGVVLSIVLLTMMGMELANWVVYPVFESNVEILIGAQAGFEIPFSRENLVFKKSEITQTQSEILTSVPNLEQVVRTLHLDQRPRYPDNLRGKIHHWKDNLLTGLRELYESIKRLVIVNIFGGSYTPPRMPTPFEDAVESLKQVRTQPVANTDIIAVAVRDREPEMAAAIANTLADVFLANELDTRKKRARSIFESIEQRLMAVRPELESARAAVAQFKQDNRVTDIQKEMDAAFHTLSMLEATYWDVSQKESVRALTTWEAMQRESTSKRDVEVRSRGTLVQKLSELAQFEAIYQPDHPKVIAARAALDDLRREMAEASPSNEAPTVDSTLNMDTEAMRKSLMDRIASVREELSDLSRLDTRFQALVWEQEHSGDVLKFLVRKREDALTAEYTTQPQARVIAPAQPQYSTAWPPKWLYRGLALLTSLALSIGLCALLERMDSTIRTPEAAMRLVGLGTLGSIPHVHGKTRIRRA